LAVGWLASQLQRRLDDPPVQITISLLTPFAAYIPAERLHVSGVLAVVASGLFLGWRGPRLLTSRTRLNLSVFWEMMVFLLNGLVFVLIGLQRPRILHTPSGQSLKQLVWHGVLISCAAILVRIAWVFTSTYLPRFTTAGNCLDLLLPHGRCLRLKSITRGSVGEERVGDCQLDCRGLESARSSSWPSRR